MSDPDVTPQPAEPEFEYAGRRYAFPTEFRLVDPVLVREVTGMTWSQFSELLESEEDRNDPTVMLGMFAVAVWQARPTLRRSKVVDYVSRIPIEALTVHGGDDDGADLEPGADADPPTVTELASSGDSSASSGETSSTPEASS